MIPPFRVSFGVEQIVFVNGFAIQTALRAVHVFGTKHLRPQFLQRKHALKVTTRV